MRYRNFAAIVVVLSFLVSLAAQDQTYLVEWTVEVSEPVSCPSSEPDPYTGAVPDFITLQQCWSEITREMEREFETLEEAEKFVEGRPKGWSEKDFSISQMLWVSRNDTRTTTPGNITFVNEDGTTGYIWADDVAPPGPLRLHTDEENQ